MTFLRPEFLYGLFALAIPVVIHLFNFRRHKKLYFSDISRLKNITTHTRKQQKLKNIIVLILRMLAVFFIVFALAGPELINTNNNLQSKSENIALYIDNSFSMMAEGTNGRLFENARQDALQIIENSTNTTSFVVLSNNNSGQLNRVLGKEAAASEMEKLEITPDTKKLSHIVGSRNRILQIGELQNCDTYIFSDFQTNATDIENLHADSINNYFFIPLEYLQNKNIFIDSCAISIPDLMTNKVIGLTVWIRNDSDIDYEKVPLKLLINDQQKAVSGVDIKAGTTKQIVLNFTVSQPGWHHGLIEIEDFPITFDDKLYFAFEIIPHIEVLVIGTTKENNYLKKFYTSDEIFNITEMNYRTIDFGKIYNFDLIILDDIPQISSGLISNIKKFITDGGNLLFIPTLNENIDNTALFLKEMNAGEVIRLDTANTRVTRLKLANNIFSESITKVPLNADLPTVHQHYSYRFPVTSGVETLVSLLSGDDFLSKKNIGSGQLYLLSSGLDPIYGNFASHLLFAPVMHGIASKNSSSQRLFYTLGQDKSISLSTSNSSISESPLTIQSPVDGQSIIPAQKQKNGRLDLSLDNITLESGYYNLKMSDSTIKVLAFNYNRDESEMDFFNNEQLIKELEYSQLSNYRILNSHDPKYTEVINALQKESDFWKLFIIFALFVILMEVIILRFWK